MSREDDRSVIATQACPARRALLRVEINDDNALSLQCGGDSEVQTDRRLSGTTFLGHERECFHACIVSRLHVDRNVTTTCAHAIMLTC